MLVSTHTPAALEIILYTMDDDEHIAILAFARYQDALRKSGTRIKREIGVLAINQGPRLKGKRILVFYNKDLGWWVGTIAALRKRQYDTLACAVNFVTVVDVNGNEQPSESVSNDDLTLVSLSREAYYVPETLDLTFMSWKLVLC